MTCTELEGYRRVGHAFHPSYFRACNTIVEGAMPFLKDALADQRPEVGYLKSAFAMCAGVMAGTFGVPAPIVERDVERLYQWEPD